MWEERFGHGGFSWEEEWMKNWKIPAVILALVYFGGYLVFNVNLGMGTTLFIGEFAYDIKDILGILVILWIVIMVTTVI